MPVDNWAAKHAKRREEERKKREHRKAERARRGDPQRFTLKGIQFHRAANDADSVWTLSSIDPDLEENEMIEVVEASALVECEAQRDRARENAKDAERMFAGIVEQLRPHMAGVESFPVPRGIIPRLIERMETAEQRVAELEERADGGD